MYIYSYASPIIFFWGILWKKSIVWKYFFHNRQIPLSYFRKNDNMKICFEIPQKIEQLTTVLGRLQIFNENMLKKPSPLRFLRINSSSV